MAGEEAAVGIRGFLGTHKCGFHGTLKDRCTDFHVHEIGLDGGIRHLSDLLSRSASAHRIESQTRLERGSGVVSADFSLSAAERCSLREQGFLSEIDLTVIESFVRALGQSAAAKNQIKLEDGLPCCFILGDFERYLQTAGVDRVTDVTEAQIWKDFRRAMHTGLREFLPFLCAQTLTLPDVRLSTGASASELTQIFIPFLKGHVASSIKRGEDGSSADGNKDQEGDVNNLLLQQRLDEFQKRCEVALRGRALHIAPSSQDDQNRRVIQVCPKSQCLRMLFPQRTRQAPEDCASFSQEEAPFSQEKESGDGSVAGSLPSQSVETPSSAAGEKNCASRKNCASEKKNVSRGGGRRRQKRKGARREVRLDAMTRLKADCRERWPKHRPPYLYFHLWKSNRDTAEAVGMLAACIGCKPRVFSVAGTKDKRAVTVQGVTAFKVSIEQMYRALLHPKWDRAVRVSDFRYQHERLRLGDLQGNFFRVVLRDVSLSAEAEVRQACDSLRANGFINFFGLQRFGTRTIRTYEAGAAILRGDFEGAVGLILGNHFYRRQPPAQSHDSTVDGPDCAAVPGVEGPPQVKRVKLYEKESGCSSSAASTPMTKEEKEFSTCRREQQPPAAEESPCALFFVTRDAAAALKTLPGRCYVERIVLTALARQPNNFLYALQQLPKNTLTLYVHAAQSLVWNGVVAHRVLEYGSRPVVGDLVVVRRVGSKRATDEPATAEPATAEPATAEPVTAEPATAEGIGGADEGIGGADEGIGDVSSEKSSRGTSAPAVDDAFVLPVAVFGDDVDHNDANFGDCKFIAICNQPVSARRHICLFAGSSTVRSAPLFEQHLNVRRLVAEEEAERYTLFDVVCSIPGDSVEYPPLLLPTYRRLCREMLGLELEDFNSSLSHHGLGGFSGGYRHIAVLPQNFRYHFVPSVPNRNTELLASDVDRLLTRSQNAAATDLATGDLAEELLSSCAPPCANGASLGGDRPVASDEAEPTAAVLLSCSLPKSAYLTMACRELFMKVE